MLLARRHLLDLLEHVHHRVHGLVGGRHGRLALDAHQLDEPGLEDREQELLVVERRQRGQRLNKFNNVIPLAIENELT